MAIQITSVVAAAQADPQLRKELHALAVAAQKNGLGSPQWDTLLKRVATSPDELASLRAFSNPDNEKVFGWTTITTITTLTTFTV